MVDPGPGLLLLEGGPAPVRLQQGSAAHALAIPGWRATEEWPVGWLGRPILGRESAGQRDQQRQAALLDGEGLRAHGSPLRLARGSAARPEPPRGGPSWYSTVSVSGEQASSWRTPKKLGQQT